ncbi:hypothetical protein PAXRUDRAFT_240595 [Paxillus rubicundulus Ve08.2h10]|uniref:Unplaced genomic scaffold scaffold_122, whole genome shotgun sequence n=1 Tax=Paxillus rubicundulus Ve08.2h10 TaxID=930991 RepID=A0A0D0E6T5_9AGAM|nr:hypothetical protein PAXRUDRAFT_240595 [Paxillus rubicundulus Ve08.2h10]
MFMCLRNVPCRASESAGLTCGVSPSRWVTFYTWTNHAQFHRDRRFYHHLCARRDRTGSPASDFLTCCAETDADEFKAW